MKALLVIIMSLCLHVTYAQKPDTTKTFIQGKELGEVVVKSSYLTREGDHILAIPTKEQRKHAVTGYDLLSNLMIPGVSVERSTGSVTTPNGAATLYIDGREVDFREVQSLRPKDVSRVEYFDVPTGKYAKDAYAINIIMKPLNNGGYTQLDASQNVGYLYGDYNLISKFVTGTKSLNLWAGYSMKNPKSSMDENETFIFPDYQLNRLQHYNNADNRQTEEYVQASISNRGRKYIWMLRGGMAWNASKNGVNNGMTEYWKTAAAIKNGSILDINTRNKSYRPSVYFYGLHTFSNTKSLDYVFDGYIVKVPLQTVHEPENIWNSNADNKQDSLSTRDFLTNTEKEKIKELASQVPDSIRNRFVVLVDKWNFAIDHNPKTQYSASIHSYAKLPEFIPLKSMGKQIVPLIMERMVNPCDFYFLVLYEAVLEGNETNDDSKFSESEQIRAIRCVKKWLDRTF